MFETLKSISIKRSKSQEKALLEKSRAWLETDERTPGIHASDILSPRIGYWSRVKPLPLEDRLVTMFLVGKVLHAFVLSAAEGRATDLQRTDSGSHVSSDLGISFSPDHLVGDMPIEFKTTRAFKAPDTLEDLWTYVEQLVVYMVAMNSPRAKLWVLYLNLRDEDKRTSPEFRCYTLRLSPEDLAVARIEIVAAKDALETALVAKDHTALPLCVEWKCGATRCGWWNDCKPEGRWTPKTIR